MNILLLGFMGTGKSTIAPFLASHFALEVVSTDQLVEEKIGESISEIFRTKGEVEFRCAERTVLLELIGRESLLIDCGGGITLDPKNREILTSLGTTICLTCSPKILEKRLVDTQRPLLSEGD
jgi:shikimate kinase